MTRRGQAPTANTISVSSYSLREQLGPIAIGYTDSDGRAHTFRRDFPKVMDISAVPRDIAQRLGVQAVEAVAFQFDGIDDSEIDRFAASARSANVTLLNAAVDAGDLLTPNDKRRASDIVGLKQWITRFAELGFRFVRVNAGSPFTVSHGAEPPSHLIAALRELGEHAVASGTRLLVENHGGPSSDPQWIAALLDSVGHEYLGLLLDLGNFDVLLDPLKALLLGAGEGTPTDPFAGLDVEPLYASIASLAGRAELVHVKAHRVDEAGAAGPIDLPRAIRILSDHGYIGPLTIEYEGEGGDPWANTRLIIDLIHAAVLPTTPGEEPHHAGT